MWVVFFYFNSRTNWHYQIYPNISCCFINKIHFNNLCTSLFSFLFFRYFFFLVRRYFVHLWLLLCLLCTQCYRYTLHQFSSHTWRTCYFMEQCYKQNCHNKAVFLSFFLSFHLYSNQCYWLYTNWSDMCIYGGGIDTTRYVFK